MRAKELGEAAARLPWLSPRAASLVALARSPIHTVWREVRTDPGAVLLLTRATPADADPFASPALLQAPAALEQALRQLERPACGFVDWNLAPLRPIYRASLAYAARAARLAEITRRCDPDRAWVAGLLAPLGWLALAATDAAESAACIADADLRRHPSAVQISRWGLSHASITRRLCRRWGLPRWLATVIGHLELPADTARVLGGPEDLFRIVQLAVALVQQDAAALPLNVGGTPGENIMGLGLTAGEVERATAELDVEEQGPVDCAWEPPESVPLLRDLLLLALERRRAADCPVIGGLESDVDQLHGALHGQRQTEQQRLHELKLRSLAEFAAGAGHEINNPLAVISGQAQYLLHHEPDPSRQRSLRTIIGQAQRIHQILNELMQYARPPRPDRQLLAAADLVQDVHGALADLAAQKQVRLLCPPPEPTLYVNGDRRQLTTALSCLLRNAIEAAPADGWAGVRVQAVAESVEFLVEDSGPGPQPAQREHLFDPFFSGRHAGRGRGLGLPTAWQLARSHGGDVLLDDASTTPTRFVLRLPRHEAPALPLAADSGVPELPAESVVMPAALVPLAGLDKAS